MKVRATNASKDQNVQISELKRIAKPGEIFDITEERYKVLAGKNDYNTVFVQKLEEEIETEVVKPVEKAVKKTVKKAKK